MRFELIAGLETHIELDTKTKVFCSCPIEFGGEPNTRCCPVCIGMPGSLPSLNHEAVRLASKAGLALNCRINSLSYFDRKNYVYPDLAKAYQITQYRTPLCEDGRVVLSGGRVIRIERIHLEEDAGKLIHRDGNTLIDYNRGGVPLIEIVTRPDFRSAAEVREYLEKIRLIMKYIEVSDCRMQEGSFRCDVNVSVRREGETELGCRTEIKNMNSFAYITKAIEYEYSRQVAIIENGGKVARSTLRYDECREVTEQIRSKEDASDYRYFPEPDLMPLNFPETEIEKLKGELCRLPDERLEYYISVFGLPTETARLIVQYKRVSDFFEKTLCYADDAKTAANLIIGEIFRALPTDAAKENFDIGISSENFGELIGLYSERKINTQVLKTTLKAMLETGKKPCELLDPESLVGISDGELSELCRRAITENEKAVKDYKAGKEAALKSLIGAVMKMTRGRASAEKAQEILVSLIV